MNVRLITKALHTLSLLSDEDYDLVLKLRALTEDERELLMTVLEPSKPTGKKASKKSSKSSQSSTKSSRASGMAAQLNRNRQRQQETMRDDDYQGFAVACVYEWTTGSGRLTVCTEPADANIHHLRTHPNYHEFTVGESAASSADNQSPANGGASSITPNSVDGTDDAGVVAHGASGGD